MLQSQCSVTGIVMNQHNATGDHATSLFLNCTTQFHKCLAVDIRADCRALSQEVHKQNRFSVRKDGAPTF